ncbi:hypothetical protein [Pseudomonas sp. UBA2684]|mgnify:CR=1 FL=1|uniref:hypothetical protein n=1 Tax=Pseudomonas sp. UBA2684 TaxID=1947311 RepID=UPI0025FBB382|nr:hypothetical protein [Pseudomonas sp. UBA2684]|tara:strand:+ start:780 stop:1577 length:798 start_codon:yes stop_codon:yes gene_type:complete
MPIMILQRFPITSCCLCGSSEKLTGEHKIKASALRKEFGREALVIGTAGPTKSKTKSAQSANSKHLKFNVSICEACNTSRTQQADREFDNFHDLALEKVKINEDPSSVFEMDRYSEGSEPYLNVFRYFAKLLSCHIAQVNAPIPIMLAKFAIGESAFNRIWLWVKTDPTYHQALPYIGEHQYAAHGGLIVYGDKNTNEPNAFHSTITVGPIQYVFHTRLAPTEKIEILEKYPDFLAWCITKVQHAKENPIPESTLFQFGLKDEDA